MTKRFVADIGYKKYLIDPSAAGILLEIADDSQELVYRDGAYHLVGETRGRFLESISLESVVLPEDDDGSSAAEPEHAQAPLFKRPDPSDTEAF